MEEEKCMRENVGTETILQGRLDQTLKQVAFCFPRYFPVGERPTAELFQENLLFSANGNKRVQMALGDTKVASDIRRKRKYIFTPRLLGDKESSMPQGREPFVKAPSHRSRR
jgi:hypothetical protein